MWLAQTLKQGKITLKTNGRETIQIQVENKKIDLNFQQEELIEDILELETQTEEKPTLKKLKNLAEKLKQNGYTITISHKGQKMLTLGAEAHPKLSQIITGTNAIEINNPTELTKLIKQQETNQ